MFANVKLQVDEQMDSFDDLWILLAPTYRSHAGHDEPCERWIFYNHQLKQLAMGQEYMVHTSANCL